MQSIEEIEAICYDNLLREAEEWCDRAYGDDEEDSEDDYEDEEEDE